MLLVRATGCDKGFGTERSRLLQGRLLRGFGSHFPFVIETCHPARAITGFE